MVKTYIVKCTRCNGNGNFAHFGTCFKCHGEGKEVMTQTQYDKYTQYSKKKENSTSYVMFEGGEADIKPLLDSELSTLEYTDKTIVVEGKQLPVISFEMNGNKCIGIKWSHDYRLVLKTLVKIYMNKQDLNISDENALKYVELKLEGK